MSYMIEFEIPVLPETVNQILAMSLKERMRRKKFWKKYVWALTTGKRPAAPLKKARLTLTRFSSTRPDPDGLTSSFKHVIDGLVEARILENDKFDNIGFPQYLWEHAKRGSGKILVKVEEVIE